MKKQAKSNGWTEYAADTLSASQIWGALLPGREGPKISRILPMFLFGRIQRAAFGGTGLRPASFRDHIYLDLEGFD
jgi:hypothetical protein